MEEITAGATIIGIINAVQMQFPKVVGIYALGLAILLGAFMGWQHFLVPDVQGGVIAALMSSGIYKLATRAGGK